LLQRLLVRNFGIIEEIDWSPDLGFNLITGETGAGKSLVVDALSALLSGKLDESSIRHGAAESRIEGVFDLSGRDDIKDWFAEHGIEIEGGTLIMSLSQKRGGRAVIRLNGAAATRNLAFEGGRKLVDIHGQSQHLSLLDPASHLDFLDCYAGTPQLRCEFGQQAQALSSLEREVSDISAREVEAIRQQDFLNFQACEIERAELSDGEDGTLEEERRVLASAEKLKLLAGEAAVTLDGDAPGTEPATSLISQASTALERLTAIDTRLKSQADVVRDALFSISEAARDIRAYAIRIEADPARLEEVDGRIKLIRDLKRKYGSTITEILAFAERARRELAEFEILGERKNTLRQEVAACRRELGRLAEGLSSRRQTAAVLLEQAVDRELADLGMEGVHFRISVTSRSLPGGLPLPGGGAVDFDNTGIDRVSFLTSTNPGEPFLPLEKIASTGELSRFTLAVKTALAQADQIPVLIFDEIDIGVGGRSGDVIGQKLSYIAQSHQVICVTHLPQIAAYGSHHFSVRKEFDGQRAVSIMHELTGGDRIAELAVMISGDRESRTSAEGARELLRKAGCFTASLKENI
jgi:DNA repair protein RecN (Recombination protein N)